MIGGLAVVGLFLGLYFGLGYPDAIESDAAHGFLRCEHGYDLINGKCTDINECIEDKENGLKLYKQTRKLGSFFQKKLIQKFFRNFSFPGVTKTDFRKIHSFFFNFNLSVSCPEFLEISFSLKIFGFG